MNILHKCVCIIEESNSIIEWISVIATFLLGVITLILSQRANNINKRLINLEENRDKEKKTPILKMTDIEYDLFELYNIKKGSLYYKIDKDKINEKTDKKYKYYIKMEYTSLTDCIIEEIDLINISFENEKNTIYFSKQQRPENTNFILTKNEKISLYLLMSEEIYTEITSGKCGKITSEFCIKTIYDEEYIEVTFFNFSYKCMYIPRSTQEITKLPFEETRIVKRNNKGTKNERRKNK